MFEANTSIDELAATSLVALDGNDVLALLEQCLIQSKGYLVG